MGLPVFVIPSNAIPVWAYAFYRRHGHQAALCIQYPQATVHENAVPDAVIALYKETLNNAVLPKRAPTYLPDRSMKDGERITYTFQQRCEDVAIKGHVCVPVQSAEACCVSAWSLLQCQQVYNRNSWYASCLESSHEYKEKTKQADFRFWLTYGAWSNCPHCYSYHFFDESHCRGLRKFYKYLLFWILAGSVGSHAALSAGSHVSAGSVSAIG